MSVIVARPDAAGANIVCEAILGCQAPAVVIVEDREGGRARVCPFHHQDMMRVSDGLIRGVGLVRPDAAEPAVAVSR